MRLLDAVVASPVRRTVKPAGIPDDEVARQAARHAAGCGPRAGQAARAAHPASAAAAGRHRASLQSNRRLRVSRRAVNPAASRRCLVVRSPGSASASTSVQPQAVAPVDRRLEQGGADADAAGGRLDVAALDQAAADRSPPRAVAATARRPTDDARRTPRPPGGPPRSGRVQRSSRSPATRPRPGRPRRAWTPPPPAPGRGGACRPVGPPPRPAGPAPCG